MSYQPEHGRGLARSRHEVKSNRKQPDYSGVVNWQGQLLRIAMWHNPPSERDKLPSYSIRLEDKAEHDATQQQRRTDKARSQTKAPRQHEVPFDDG